MKSSSGSQGSAEEGRPRWLTHAAWFGVAVAASTLVWFSALQVLAPPATTTVAAPLPTYTVQEGEVGAVAPARATISFEEERKIYAGSSGTITALNVAPGSVVDSGTVLLSINNRPLVAVLGEVPTYRDLTAGAKGRDVAQLRAFLGLPEGDVFDQNTVSAVRAFQRFVGVPDDGNVLQGDFAFFPRLPASVQLEPGTGVGSLIDANDSVLAVLSDAAQLQVPSDNTGQFTEGMNVTVLLPEGAVSGELGPLFASTDGLSVFSVLSADGTSPCVADCGRALLLSGVTEAAAEIELVTVTVGVVVPDAAIATMPDGSLIVRSTSGERLPVTVITRGSGTSIVEGVDVGEEILLFPNARSDSDSDSDSDS